MNFGQWMSILQFANMQNLSIWYLLPIFKCILKRFPTYQTMVMVGFYTQQAFQPYKIYNIWSWDDTQLNILKNNSINRHYIAFNKNVNKTLLKYQTNGRLSLEM